MFYRKVFQPLAKGIKKKLVLTDILSPDGIFGLYQTGEITAKWLLLLLDRLEGRTGTFELYTHPSNAPEGQGQQELKALMSPEVRDKIEEKGIKLIRYLDIDN